MAAPDRQSSLDSCLEHLPASPPPDATILAFQQPDAADQAVFMSQASESPAVPPEISAAMLRVKTAEHAAWVLRNAVSAQLNKEPINPLAHPIRTLRHERQLARLQARKDSAAARLRQMQLALSTLEYGPEEYAPVVWIPEAPLPHGGTGLLRQAFAAHLKTWLKTKLA